MDTFFFQAEDGIRDYDVTGVQTCALPISKSASKLSLIQNIDKKIPLDEIINSKGVEFSQLLFELESIVFSGTKLNIDYYINDILDEDHQLDLHDYFIGANNEDVSVALQEFDGEFDEDDIRLYRIKFISDIAN